jgi:DNA polymerase-3 subunit delta'
MSFKTASALQLIERARTRGRLGHAYMITGPKEADLEGFAVKFLNLVSGQNHADLEAWKDQGIPIVRPESKSRRILTDSVRELEQQIHMSAGPGGNKFGVIVDADRMQVQAQNAFLKTLEEPPARTLLLLLTAQPQQLLDTIRSRVIQVPLMPEDGARIFTASERKLLDLLSNISQHSSGSLAAAMTIRREFEDLLDEVKDRITKDLEDEFQREKDFYKNTTDGQWLKSREIEMEANIASQYSLEREMLMELLLAWMGDVMRHQVGAERFDLPEYGAATHALAQRWEPSAVSRRLKELRKLQTNLHTNVSEGLALDVAFMSAFA